MEKESFVSRTASVTVTEPTTTTTRNEKNGKISTTTTQKKEEFLETSIDGGSSTTTTTPIASVTTGPSSMAISIQTSEFSELKIMRTKTSGSRTTTEHGIGSGSGGIGHSSYSYPYVSNVSSTNGDSPSNRSDSPSGRSSSNPNSPLITQSRTPQVRVTNFGRLKTPSVDEVDGDLHQDGVVRRIILEGIDPSLTKQKKATSVHTSQPLSQYKFAPPPLPPSSSLSSYSVPPPLSASAPKMQTAPLSVPESTSSSSSISDNPTIVKTENDFKMREAFSAGSDSRRSSKAEGRRHPSKNKRDYLADCVVFCGECFLCHGE